MAGGGKGCGRWWEGPRGVALTIEYIRPTPTPKFGVVGGGVAGGRRGHGRLGNEGWKGEGAWQVGDGVWH